MKNKDAYIRYFMLFIKLFVPSLLLLFLIRGFILIPVRVDGNSMEKTLNQGDMILMEKFSAIKRFDVIVFKLPSEEIYIKRVIGLPGDSVRYENDQLYINGEPIEEPFLEKNLKRDHESVPYTTDFNLLDLTNEAVLSENSYFVLGDNRRMSKDSRSFGAIEANYILGKAQIVYYPLKDIKLVPR